MTHVKTAISLDKDLYARLEALATEMQVSRSQLVGLALEEFFKRRQNLVLLERINAAYEDDPESMGPTPLRRMGQTQRHLLEGQW